jgi:hypothetical protein
MKALIRTLFSKLGLEVRRRNAAEKRYVSDGLSTVHNHDFLNDPRYQQALKRAVQADPGLGYMTWRLHVALWAAHHACRLEGDFVECGVNKGFLSSAIMEYLGWNNLDRRFFLFDTFEGIVADLLNKDELESGRLEHNRLYKDTYAGTQANFAECQRVYLVKGIVPQTLETTSIDKVAYLSIDMNCAGADVAAFEHFWPKMPSGGLVLLDDYAYCTFEETYRAFNEAAARHHISILSLPTGQGLIIKS